MQYLSHVIQGVAVGLLLSHMILLCFYVMHLDHFKAIIVSIILLVLPLSSNIVDFILPGWHQIYIATAQNWPATWQTRPTETSVVVVQIVLPRLYLHTVLNFAHPLSKSCLTPCDTGSITHLLRKIH